MKKIIFGITSLTLGGAERVLVDIANELCDKYDITIFELYGRGEFEKELNPKIKLIKMKDKSYNELSKLERVNISMQILFNKKSLYRKYIKGNYDVEIAFLEGPITRMFAVKNDGINKIVWVHNDIMQVFGEKFKAKLKRKLDKKCYSYYNSVVFVSQDNREKFEEIYDLKNDKFVITNYISSQRVMDKANEHFGNIYKEDEINFLTVARLTKQKAIDRLVRVHSRLIEDGYNHNFYVIGDGPEREYVKQLIESYKVQDTFKLLGKKENPYPYIRNCDIFALLSNYEGYGMTLLETRILKKPIIITNTAAREAVERL